MACVRCNQMGSSGSRSEWGSFAPHLQNYTLAHIYSPLSIYRHLYSGEEIMEFKQPIATREDMDRHLQTFTARYQHIYLVATLYAEAAGRAGCGGGEGEVAIYYERAVTNLSRVNDIPFADSLHCLGVALKGFEILFKSYGYFEVYEDMFHICQRGRLKVWCNRHIYKNVPEQYLLGGGTEQDMVARVLNIVQQNTEGRPGNFPITQTLLALPKLTFTNALAAFRQICREQHLFVPQHLESLRNSVQIERMLDIYQPPVKSIPLLHAQPQPSPTTEMARSGSSSRHQNRLLPSERGRSLDASGRKTFEQASQQQQFPQFVVKRDQELPRSRSLPQIARNTPPSNSRLLVQNAPQSTHSHLYAAHPNLQQFRKETQPESKLKKKNAAINQSQPIIRFANNQQVPNNQQLNQTRVIGKSIHQQTIPNQPIPYMVQPNYQPVQIVQRVQPIKQIQLNQQVHQFNQQGIIPRQQSRPVSHHEQSNYNQNYLQTRPQTPNHNNQQFQPQSIPTINSPFYKPLQPQLQQHPINTYQRPIHINQNRGTSLPIRVTYAESPKKLINRRQPKQNIINYRTKDPIRLITMGEGSGKKTAEFVAPTDQKEDKFTFSQLESKIELLESFTDNRITTQQFLPNQSHALSNIKWERGSNSGRDSVSSAFRKDILDPSTKMPSNRLSNEAKEEIGRRDSNAVSRFDYSQYETDPKLLELIKSAHSKYTPNLSKTNSIEDRLRKYQQEYSRKDKIKEIAAYSIPKKKDNEYIKSNFSKTANLTSWSSTQEGPSFRKKTEPYLNKVSAISEKWEEQNICSTSQGSRGHGLASNLDEDILQDMAQFGLQVGRRAR